jgi:hypothetical protein
LTPRSSPPELDTHRHDSSAELRPTASAGPAHPDGCASATPPARGSTAILQMLPAKTISWRGSQRSVDLGVCMSQQSAQTTRCRTRSTRLWS